MSGNTWLYVSMVKVILVWPSRSLTILGFSLAANSNVAQVCLKSYNLILVGKLDFSNRGLMCLLTIFRSCKGWPVWLANTRSLFSYSAPNLNLSSV